MQSMTSTTGTPKPRGCPIPLGESGSQNVVDGSIHSWKWVGVRVRHCVAVEDEGSAKSPHALRVAVPPHRRHFHDILQVFPPAPLDGVATAIT